MELTQDFEVGIIERIQRDRAFAEALLDEIEETLRESEYGVAQDMLHTLVTGTLGFDALSNSLSMTSETLTHMLSSKAKTSPEDLNAIASALKRAFGVSAS